MSNKVIVLLLLISFIIGVSASGLFTRDYYLNEVYQQNDSIIMLNLTQEINHCIIDSMENELTIKDSLSVQMSKHFSKQRQHTYISRSASVLLKAITDDL